MSRRLQIGVSLVPLPQDELGMPVENLSGFGWHHTSLGTQQELLTYLAFQRRQLLAERGLRHVKDIRSLRQTADIDNLYEILQAPQVHVVSSIPLIDAH